MRAVKYISTHVTHSMDGRSSVAGGMKEPVNFHVIQFPSMLIHASTIVTRSPSVLLSHISRLSQKYARQNLLFALSPNFDAGELSNVVNNLTAFPGQSVGCLSAPLPGHNYQERISCSFAFFDADKSTVFRSTIPGRAAPQVGRWHAFRNKNNAPPPDQTLPDGAFGWADIWDGNTAAVNVPFELQHIKSGVYHDHSPYLPVYLVTAR